MLWEEPGFCIYGKKEKGMQKGTYMRGRESDKDRLTESREAGKAPCLTVPELRAVPFQCIFHMPLIVKSDCSWGQHMIYFHFERRKS